MRGNFLASRLLILLCLYLYLCHAIQLTHLFFKGNIGKASQQAIPPEYQMTFGGQVVSKKIGRNDPCPCGSGKKYKRCCMEKDEIESSFDGFSTSDTVHELRERIAGFVFQDKFRSDFNRALEQFWGDKHKAPIFPFADNVDNSLFMDWYVHDYRLSGSHKRLIDLYAEEKGPRLPTAARELLKQLQNPLFSAYEMIEVEKGVGSHVRDIFQGHGYYVQDVSTSKKLQKWDIILARIVMEGQALFFSGPCLVIGQRDKPELETFTRKLFKEYSQQHLDATWQDFMRDNSYKFVAFVRRMAERPRKTRFKTSDGDELRFTRGFYQVKDRRSVEITLTKHASLLYVGTDKDKSNTVRFDWVGEPVDVFTSEPVKGKSGFIVTASAYPDPSGKGRPVIGNITLDDTRLILTCFSTERLAAGKRLLEACCGDSIAHVSDSKESIERWLEEPSKEASPAKPEKRIPRAVERKLLARVMEKHYQRWIDEPLPALGGQTPKQAVKSKRGRARVIALLKDMENREAHQKARGEATYDMGKLKSALGIRDEEFLDEKPLAALPTKSLIKPKVAPASDQLQPGDAGLLSALENLEDVDLPATEREKYVRQIWAKRNRIPELLTRRLIEGKAKIPEMALHFITAFAGEDSLPYFQRISEEREAPDVIRLAAHQLLRWPEEGEIEARGAFLSSLKDAYGSLKEFLSLSSQNEDRNEEMLTEVIRYIMALSPLERLVLLKDIAAQSGDRALLLFRALLHYPGPDISDVAMNFLVDRGDRGALRAVKRLSDFLTEPAAQAEAIVAMRSLEARPLRNVTGQSFVHPLHSAYLTIIDGDGAQMIIIVRRHFGSTLKFASVLHKDRYGIKDVWGHVIGDIKDVKGVIDTLSSGIGTLVRAPLEAVQQVLAEAARVNARMGNPIPLAFELWEPMFYDNPEQDAPPEGYPLLDDQPFIRSKSMLEESPELLDTPEFESWFFAPEDVERYAPRSLRGITDARITKAIKGIVTEEVRELLRTRLLRQAWILERGKLRRESRLALAAAGALRPDSRVSLTEHPFLQAMAKVSLENLFYYE